jgi:hypothetical protein
MKNMKLGDSIVFAKDHFQEDFDNLPKKEQDKVLLELGDSLGGKPVSATKKRVIMSDEFRGVDYEISEITIQGDKLYEFSFGNSEHSNDREHLQGSTTMSKEEAIKDAKEAILTHLKYD